MTGGVRVFTSPASQEIVEVALSPHAAPEREDLKQPPRLGALRSAAIEPAIRGKFIGGFFTESDFTGDIHKFTTGLAQAVSPDEVKAAYLFRFTSYVEWPPASFADTESPIVIGVADAAGVLEHLTAQTRGKRLAIRRRALFIHAIEPQHVEVHVEAERAAEALDQRHRAAPSGETRAAAGPVGREGQARVRAGVQAAVAVAVVHRLAELFTGTHDGAVPATLRDALERRQQGVLAPVQFVVFLISLALVVRYLTTGSDLEAATLSVIVKTLFLYTIMITGCSSGYGLETARHFHDRGWNVVATMRTVASMWKMDKQSQHAFQIAEESGKLYDKFKLFMDDMVKVGNQLNSTKNSYEDAMKKLVTGRGNLVNQAEKIREMGAKNTRRIDEKITQRAIED